MAKLKIIKSDSLVTLQDRIQNKMMESHNQIEIVKKELAGLESRGTNSLQMQSVCREIDSWQSRLTVQRELLCDIKSFISEIEI